MTISRKRNETNESLRTANNPRRVSSCPEKLNVLYERKMIIDEFIKKFNALVSSKKYEEAMNYCAQELQKLMNKQEFTHDERLYVATIYSSMVPFLDKNEGLKCLDAAISYVPNSAELYYQRAELKCNLSDFQGAIDDYSIVIENAPEPMAYGLRGNAKVNLGDISGAVSDFKKILEYEPDNKNAQNAINSLIIQYAQANNIPCLSCTLKTGKKVHRIVTDFGTFDIPNLN